MADYVYTDHAQYTIKTYAKMALFRLVLTGPLSRVYILVVQLYDTEYRGAASWQSSRYYRMRGPPPTRACDEFRWMRARARAACPAAGQAAGRAGALAAERAPCGQN